MTIVFDRVKVRRNRERVAQNTDDFFLFNWAADQITERLAIVTRSFDTKLQIGTRGKKFDGAITMDLACGYHAHILGDEEFLPFGANTFDLVLSVLSLHTVNDLPGALVQIKKCLKPDGLFLGAVLGGESLHELRSCLTRAEIELTGGMSPRVAPFTDKPQMGALLQRAGFALPVVDSDIVTVTYESIFALMHDLRKMGEGNAISKKIKTFSRRDLFIRANELYKQDYAEGDGRIRASFEIIFLHGWAPSDSQQKPLRRGSATTRLADFLGTEEIKAAEKPH
jgi:SAM-dependent methyltransferase